MANTITNRRFGGKRGGGRKGVVDSGWPKANIENQHQPPLPPTATTIPTATKITHPL